MLRLNIRLQRKHFKGICVNKYFQSLFTLIRNRGSIFSPIMYLIPAHYSIIIMNHNLFIQPPLFVYFQYSISDHESHVSVCSSDYFLRIHSLIYNCWVTGHCHVTRSLESRFTGSYSTLSEGPLCHLKVALSKLPAN